MPVWFTTQFGVNSVVWNLKEFAEKNHGITTAVQLQKLIEEKLGMVITVQTLRALMRHSPAAPRGEMIQLLCDAFNCRSDAFYVFTPNVARAQQWAKDRSEGKEASPLYQAKGSEPVAEIAELPDETVQGEHIAKSKSLRATFTDPRTLYRDKPIPNE